MYRGCGWGGGGDVTVLATGTHGRCYATGGVGAGDVTVLATCTHVLMGNNLLFPSRT